MPDDSVTTVNRARQEWRTVRHRLFNLFIVLDILTMVLLVYAERAVADDLRRPEAVSGMLAQPHDGQLRLETPARAREFDPGRASFSLMFDDELSPYSVMSTFVLPCALVYVEVAGQRDSRRNYQCRSSSGRLSPAGHGRWRWTAPAKAGVYPLIVKNTATGEAVRLHVFVLARYRGSESVRGFNIGRYPPSRGTGLPCFDRPAGLIEVSERLTALRLSPHFTLGQFLCKQTNDYPQYLALSERLLMQLELLLERANAAGWPADTFFIMSGYRTPYYNLKIGNTTNYSRHVYGDAADIFIDADHDGVMDDLNGDGASTKEDADLLAALVEAMTDEPWFEPFIGGLGAYGPTASHGPFIHVDTRGVIARW